MKLEREFRDEVLHTVENLESLPTLPVVVELLTREIGSKRATATSIARIIEDDQTIMARVLKLVNSPLYAPTFRQRGGITIQQAVVRLGSNTLRNLVLTTSVMNLFPTVRYPAFDRTEFWRHSICVGFVARVLGEFATVRLDYEASDLSLAGLCHDLGKVILDQYFNEAFQDVLADAHQGGKMVFEAERDLIKVDHTEVGATLARRWKLPDSITDAMRYHHTPERAVGKDHELMIHAVHLADYICNHQGIGFSGNCRILEFPRESFEALGLDVGSIPAILTRVHQEADKSNILLSITAGVRAA